MLYSEDSMKKLVKNNSMRYEKDLGTFMRDFKNNSGRGEYLLSRKFRYRKFIDL